MKLERVSCERAGSILHAPHTELSRVPAAQVVDR